MSANRRSISRIGPCVSLGISQCLPIMDEWKAGEGPDNFGSDPPNATLSVYEPGRNDNTLAVVEISHPVMEGKDLVYNYKLIKGTMPKGGGATALFIDWIGVGGGVGPGFHGVGAGARGVGLRR